MKTLTRIPRFPLSAAGFFAAFLLLGGLTGWASPAAAEQAIVGSWRTEVTVTDPFFDQFTGLDTYDQAGTVVSSNAPDGVNSTGHGAWSVLPQGEANDDGNDFAETALFEVIDSTAFPPGAQYVKVLGEIKIVTHDFMTGSFVVQFLDANFNVLFSASGTTERTRIVVEPLP